MPTLSLQESVMITLNSLLQHVATKKLGPTRTSRFFYLWFFTLASGYSWVTKNSPIRGVKDGFDWSEEHVHVIQETILTFVPNFDLKILQRIEDSAFSWNEEDKKFTKIRVLFEGQYKRWKSKWQTW